MNTAARFGKYRVRAGARKTIRISVSPWARCWWAYPAGVQATRLGGTIDVPRSVPTAKTPVAAYTRCPRVCDCTALEPPDGHRCRPPDGQMCDAAGGAPTPWRDTSIDRQLTGGPPPRDLMVLERFRIRKTSSWHRPRGRDVRRS